MDEINHQPGCRVPAGVAVGEFERFLTAGRGVSTATQACYLRHVRALLGQRVDTAGVIDFSAVSPQWVRSYVTDLGLRYAPMSSKLIATAIRSFLRFAWMSGWTVIDLTGAVGVLVTHRSGQIPRALSAAELRRLLAVPDRRTRVGARDYAVLVMLSRLGLRAGEVAALRLDDFDWLAATLTPGSRAAADCAFRCLLTWGRRWLPTWNGDKTKAGIARCSCGREVCWHR